MSAERSNYGEVVNARNTELMSDILGREGFVNMPVKGMYHGTPEASFLVKAYDSSQYTKLLNIAREFAQESILVVNPDGLTTLVAVDGRAMGLGSMREIIMHDKVQNYTMIDGRYYVAG